MRGKNRSIYSNAQRLLLASSSLVAALALVPQEARAQSVWGGVGSTTANSNYRTDTNWVPAGSPIGPGQSAVFDATGNASVVVVGLPLIKCICVFPDTWTFNAASQSFTITGNGVNFNFDDASSGVLGIINNANANQTISIDNKIRGTGAQVQQLGNSTLILSGFNDYTGATTVSAGALKITSTGTIFSAVTIASGAAVSNDGRISVKATVRAM